MTPQQDSSSVHSPALEKFKRDILPKYVSRFATLHDEAQIRSSLHDFTLLFKDCAEKAVAEYAASVGVPSASHLDDKLYIQLNCCCIVEMNSSLPPDYPYIIVIACVGGETSEATTRLRIMCLDRAAVPREQLRNLQSVISMHFFPKNDDDTTSERPKRAPE